MTLSRASLVLAFSLSSMVLALLVPREAASQSGQWSSAFAPPPGGNGVGDPTFSQVTALINFENDLIVGGDFSSCGAIAADNVARWDGFTWHSLGEGLDAAPTCFAVFRGDLIAAGYFTHSGTTEVSHIARWDGSAWQPLGLGVDDYVRTLCVHEDRLYAGGNFSTAGTAPAPHLAKWDGGDWEPVGDFDSRVESLVSFGGDLYAGGLFDSIDGVVTNNVAVFGGASWSPLGDGTDGRVRSMTVYRGQLVVGGSFASAGGNPASNVATWDGVDWSSLAEGTDGEVFALAPFRQTLVVGGDFATAGGTPASHLARWDGGTWTTFGAVPDGTDERVNVARQHDGWLYVGGRFGTAGGITAGRISTWGDDPAPPLTYLVNPDGSGDFQTIRQAVDAAEIGAIVELGDGVFAGEESTNVSFPKAVTVDSSSDDAQNSTVLWEGPFDRWTIETSGVTVRNLTLTGGGQLRSDTGTTLSGMRLEGVGLRTTSGSNAEIRESTILNATVMSWNDSQVVITDCEIHNGHLDVDTGHIWILNSFCSDLRIDMIELEAGFTSEDSDYSSCSIVGDLSLTRCRFTSCGISTDEISSPAIEACSFDNCTLGSGRSFLSIRDSVFRETAMNFVGGEVSFDRCLLSGPQSQILIDGSILLRVTRTTFVGVDRPAVVVYPDAEAEVLNSIFSDIDGAAIQCLEGLNLDVSCNLFHNVDSWIEGDCPTTIGDDNIEGDPLFCDPEAGLYTLSTLSPAAPDNSPCGTLIGAYGVTCGPGACCLVDGTCIIVDEDECDASLGDFLGVDVICSPNPCPDISDLPDITGAPALPFGFVAPNPADRVLTISLGDVPLRLPTKVTLIDASGRKGAELWHGLPESRGLTVELPRELPRGVYYVRVTAGSQECTRKVVLR